MTSREFDQKLIYDVTKGTPIENLEINLGTSDISKINCANHKCDLGARAAMLRHVKICDQLKVLNNHNHKVIKSKTSKPKSKPNKANISHKEKAVQLFDFSIPSPDDIVIAKQKYAFKNMRFKS